MSPTSPKSSLKSQRTHTRFNFLLLGLRGVHTVCIYTTSALTNILSLLIVVVPFLFNMATSTTTTSAPPRIIPERGYVLKRILKMVMSFLLCSGSAAPTSTDSHNLQKKKNAFL
ncbi:unnamed protein product [Vicia faba]|uniref:Transmembrane protein n=1 Tax=Vicia faba TaxID=3906 RepID=A0AAV1B7X5_VICFA|nr:unnamed protein product [Vicia faba]